MLVLKTNLVSLFTKQLKLFMLLFSSIVKQPDKRSSAQDLIEILKKVTLHPNFLIKLIFLIEIFLVSTIRRPRLSLNQTIAYNKNRAAMKDYTMKMWPN
jgi:hypothetical protein